jgi:hypothetical protein
MRALVILMLAGCASPVTTPPAPIATLEVHELPWSEVAQAPRGDGTQLVPPYIGYDGGVTIPKALDASLR